MSKDYNRESATLMLKHNREVLDQHYKDLITLLESDKPFEDSDIYYYIGKLETTHMLTLERLERTMENPPQKAYY